MGRESPVGERYRPSCGGRRVSTRESAATGKVAFCFPGQGALEAGMGRELAEAVPAAMDVYRVGSEASGLDLQKLCFETPLEELVDTEVQQPALIATSLAILAAIRDQGLEPDIVVGHSVGEFAALASVSAIGTAEAIGFVRERGLAMAEAARLHPGAMAAILGLEDEAVEELCNRIEGVWPANYNCPGQVVVSGEHAAVDRLCVEAESIGARRAIKLKVSGAFHSPLVGRAADRLRPAIESIRFQDPVAPFMSTVTAHVEPVTRFASILVEQLTAPVKFTQAARELVQDGVTTFVEVGPGNVLSGLIKRIDRSVRAISVNDAASLEKAREMLAT
ncbi:MAG: [acyl-carrier-protein] S-malonyltransferase [Thermoleophilia bacterium]|nr:[acyl-carrier-protein] S-malonyltransferase [Thermoleophilia bacterium]